VFSGVRKRRNQQGLVPVATATTASATITAAETAATAAAAAAAVSTAAAAATAIATAAAAAAESATTAAIFAGTGFIDTEGATSDGGIVQLSDRFAAAFVVHFHKAEAFGTLCVTVLDDLGGLY
jgi:hypothetical protein